MTAHAEMTYIDEPGLPYWLRRLSLIAQGDQPGALVDVAELLGHATRSRGIVLWESPSSADSDDLSVLTAWLHPSVPRMRAIPSTADAVTREADVRRTLALSNPNGGSLLGLLVDAALPLEYADGSRGVLTLCGSGGLTGGAFDTAAELLTILPAVLAVRRERKTLALVNAANDIMHEADIESGTQPLPRQELQAYFNQICARLSESMYGADVSLYLRECDADASCAYFAGWPAATTNARTAPIVVSGPRPCSPQPGVALIEELLTNGTHVWGVLRCESASGPPAYFTHTDLTILRPVAAQLARYWANWLNRRALFEENQSWRHLANGITEFNQILTQALRQDDAKDRQPQVAAAALRVASSVVPTSTGAAVYVAAAGGKKERPSLQLASATGDHGVSEAGRAQAEHAYRSRKRTVGHVPNADDADGWIVSAPIRVGQQAYGALIAEGPGSEPPANSAQVYDILSDQLGLYRHLAHTMDALKTVQNEQADAMEDLKHQLVSPLRAATDRTDLVLRLGRFDRRTQYELEATRGLCRKASRVAMSAGVFATLSKGQLPEPRKERLGAGDLRRMLIAAAADCQTLSNPEMGRRFTVNRQSLDTLDKRLVQADSSFLQQCVGNLFDNADKYSYPNTEVTISATVTDHELAINVISTGVPVRSDDRRRCLERNWRGPEARNSTGEGSGIGLWIVDHLMRSMNGRVELHPDNDTLCVALILPTT